MFHAHGAYMQDSEIDGTVGKATLANVAGSVLSGVPDVTRFLRAQALSIVLLENRVQALEEELVIIKKNKLVRALIWLNNFLTFNS